MLCSLWPFCEISREIFLLFGRGLFAIPAPPADKSTAMPAVQSRTLALVNRDRHRLPAPPATTAIAARAYGLGAQGWYRFRKLFGTYWSKYFTVGRGARGRRRDRRDDPHDRIALTCGLSAPAAISHFARIAQFATARPACSLSDSKPLGNLFVRTASTLQDEGPDFGTDGIEALLVKGLVGSSPSVGRGRVLRTVGRADGCGGEGLGLVIVREILLIHGSPPKRLNRR